MDMWVTAGNAEKITGLTRYTLKKLADMGQIRMFKMGKNGWGKYHLEDLNRLSTDEVNLDYGATESNSDPLYGVIRAIDVMRSTVLLHKESFIECGFSNEISNVEQALQSISETIRSGSSS